MADPALMRISLNIVRQQFDNAMNQFVITNVATYKAIALDAHKEMHEHINSGRRPKDDGSPGWIITFDPEQRSFKKAMIGIVFTGMWLEALLHLLIVRDHGIEKFKEFDFKSYSDKMRLLGCSDQRVLDAAEKFRKCRKELVHEKAHFDTGEIKTAQDEADNAHQLLVAVDSLFVS
jgi:hypothetical protein